MKENEKYYVEACGCLKPYWHKLLNFDGEWPWAFKTEEEAKKWLDLYRSPRKKIVEWTE